MNKQSRFPFVNLNTGKIYNCKKGSYQHWHEKGHLVFDRLEWAARMKLYQNYAFLFWMFSMTLGIVNKFMLILALPLMFVYLYIEIYEEIYCNNYAKEKYKKEKVDY